MPNEFIRSMIGQHIAGRVFLVVIMSLSACKGDGAAGPLFTLTVVTTDGVGGTPQRGTISSPEGESVNYEFSLRAGFKDLAVVIDGAQVPHSGTVTMDKDHTLYA